MLKINDKGMVLGEDIHQAIQSKNKNYRDWVTQRILDADLIQGKDFLAISLKSTGGRPKTQLFFTLEAAKEICLLERNSQGKEIRRWLIDLSQQRENKELLSHDEVVMLSKLKAFFKYVDNQKQIETIHKNKTVPEGSAGHKYAEWNLWRNEMLGINKDILDAKIKEFCIENSRNLPKITSNRDKIMFLDKYDSLKNAVWDFLKVQGSFDAEKLSGLVKRMAEAEKLAIYKKNEDNLFQDKENVQLKLN
jgi:phage anti-repressor protein